MAIVWGRMEWAKRELENRSRRLAAKCASVTLLHHRAHRGARRSFGPTVARSHCWLPIASWTGTSSHQRQKISRRSGRGTSDGRRRPSPHGSWHDLDIQKAPPVTFQALARLRIDLMRRTAIISVLLSLVIAGSASACVGGWGSQSAHSCLSASTRRTCVRNEHRTATMRPACGDVLKSQPGRCGMRSFIQFQFVTLHASEISAPLQHAAGSISVPFDSRIVVSSIGSPETDRGPPRS